MSLKDDLAAAQTAADAANATLATLQAQVTALAPHESLIERMEAHAAILSIECGDTLRGIASEFRALLGL